MNNEVYILTILKERPELFPELEVSAYRNMEDALKVYDIVVDEAREEAEDYEWNPHEDSELCTDTYRYFRIYDVDGVHAITIEIRLRDIIGEEVDDI